MFDFRKIADGLYGLYKGGERVTPLPLSREEYAITYVLSGWGLRDGFCCFGIRRDA